MTPHQALQVATINGARNLGFDGDIGSLEEGKLADLSVLEANPLDDLRNSERIRWTMRTTRVTDPADAADVLLDTMVRVLGPELDLPDQRADAWSFLLVTALNVARIWCRYEARRETEPLGQVPASDGRGWEVLAWGWKLCERLELEEALEDALACLTPDQREAIELQYCEQWTAPEVAEHRGCSPDAVRKLTAKALFLTE